MRTITRFIGAATAAIALASTVQAAILTFEELPHEFELQGVGDTVLSNGFLLQYAPAPGEPFPVGFFAVGPSWPFNGRSTALEANSCSATTTLTAQDNNPITLVAIDLATSNGDPSATVTFEGMSVEGQLVQETVTLGGRRTWRTFLFGSTFRRMVYVRWTQGDCVSNPPHMFDNVRVFPSWRGSQEE